jgi:hypothetical protein
MVNMLAMSSILCGTNDFHMTDENTIFQELSLDVGVEFIGERTGDIASDAPEPDISEEEKLRALEKECSSDMTILYVHGGGL